ncbi:OmpA family protein [Aureitalea marina]|uniref:OmpA-like domain-containing protein n=1 Tax=Aureitalea marina TaxID=930804 RepID=A0A2S7KPP7_9FLAO|nr:OmpA family protein [Aureitalea marina]PQB04543.1 hypothetical protein BST85_06240 [Aureitalea marina]
MQTISKQLGLLLLLLLPIGILQGQSFRNITMTGGLSVMENNDGSQLPTLSDLDFKNPFFFIFEGRFTEAFAINASLYTNEPELKDGTQPFLIGGQVSGQWYFDQYIFNNEDFEWSIGAGIGLYKPQRLKSRSTFGFNTIFRYWVSERIAFSFQGVTNFGFSEDPLINNFYQYNFGVVWGSKARTPKRNAYLESQEILEEDAVSSERKKAIVDLTPEEPPQEEVVAVVPEPEPEEVQNKPREFESIYFDRNSSYYNKQEALKLDRVLVALQANRAYRVKAEAYTDASGDAVYNQWLADRRLKRVTDYLLAAGIDASRIEGISVGIDPESVECLDVPSPCSVESQRQYRRVQFLLFEQ